MAICVDPLEVITDDLMLSHVFYHVTFNMLVSIILSFSETFIVLLLHRFLCMLTCHSRGPILDDHLLLIKKTKILDAHLLRIILRCIS